MLQASSICQINQAIGWNPELLATQLINLELICREHGKHLENADKQAVSDFLQQAKAEIYRTHPFPLLRPIVIRDNYCGPYKIKLAAKKLLEVLVNNIITSPIPSPSRETSEEESILKKFMRFLYFSCLDPQSKSFLLPPISSGILLYQKIATLLKDMLAPSVRFQAEAKAENSLPTHNKYLLTIQEMEKLVRPYLQLSPIQAAYKSLAAAIYALFLLPAIQYFINELQERKLIIFQIKQDIIFECCVVERKKIFPEPQQFINFHKILSQRYALLYFQWMDLGLRSAIENLVTYYRCSDDIRRNINTRIEAYLKQRPNSNSRVISYIENSLNYYFPQWRDQLIYETSRIETQYKDFTVNLISVTITLPCETAADRPVVVFYIEETIWNNRLVKINNHLVADVYFSLQGERNYFYYFYYRASENYAYFIPIENQLRFWLTSPDNADENPSIVETEAAKKERLFQDTLIDVGRDKLIIKKTISGTLIEEDTFEYRGDFSPIPLEAARAKYSKLIERFISSPELQEFACTGLSHNGMFGIFQKTISKLIKRTDEEFLQSVGCIHQGNSLPFVMVVTEVEEVMHSVTITQGYEISTIINYSTDPPTSIPINPKASMYIELILFPNDPHFEQAKIKILFPNAQELPLLSLQGQWQSVHLPTYFYQTMAALVFPNTRPHPPLPQKVLTKSLPFLPFEPFLPWPRQSVPSARRSAPQLGTRPIFRASSSQASNSPPPSPWLPQLGTVEKFRPDS